MRVLVIGAHGKVAKHLARRIANEPDITELAMIRNPDQESFFSDLGIETLHLDLVEATEQQLADAMRTVDAVIFSAGAGGKGLDKTVNVDLDGAIKSMTAAEQAGLKRFIMVSTFRTGREEIAKGGSIQVYTICKTYADEWLKHRTELDWTIIHPGILVDTLGTGQVKVGTGMDINEIPREDVADTLLAVLKNDKTIHQEFEVLAGDQSVTDAVASL